MDYEGDLCPAHSFIRLTVMAETVTQEMAEEIYRHLSEATSSGGPYAAIYDLSATKHTTMPTNTVRSFAHRPPSVRMGRKQVVVGEEPVIFGLARVFEMCGEGDRQRVSGRPHSSGSLRHRRRTSRGLYGVPDLAV